MHKGNPDWNDSAPHGARRVMSRAKARQILSLEVYTASMQGIYTTSDNEQTLNMACTSMADILDVIRNP